MSPQSSNDATGVAEEQETFELLNAEDEKPEELDLPKDSETKEKEDEVEPEDEEEDELKEIEEELEAPKEEDLLELVTPVRRKEILAKYPKLFKDFPYLEKAYYRDQQFTEMLPTIQDAKVAVEKAQILDRTEQQVMNGDITSILTAARDENQEAFYKIADNYLGALRHVDQQAYFHVLGNVLKDTIITMVQEARSLGEQGAPLQAAANVLNQFIFGSQTFKPPTTLSRQVRPEDQSREQRIQQEDQQRIYSQFESVRDDLQVKADNVLKSTISGHIDPNGSMTDYVKNHATKEALDNLESLMSRDTRFRSLLDKLWEKAFHSGFEKSATEKIRSAYLSKAKTLLPAVIKKARSDALRGRASRSEETIRGTGKTDKEERVETRREPSSNSKIRKSSDIPRGMSTLDVLMKD